MDDPLLYYIRHAPTRGEDLSPKEPELACVADFRNLSPEDRELAKEAGRRAAQGGTVVSVLFYGGISRTLQTGFSFFEGQGRFPTEQHVIREIWDDDIYRAIDTPPYRALVKTGVSKSEAVRRLCTPEQVTTFTGWAVRGVQRMLSIIGPGRRGLAVGHDPIIPMAAGDPDTLLELHGFVFTRSERTGVVSVTGKISW